MLSKMTASAYSDNFDLDKLSAISVNMKIIQFHDYFIKVFQMALILYFHLYVKFYG